MNRIIRGGGWAGDARDARLADRLAYPLNRRDTDLGFRCVVKEKSK